MSYPTYEILVKDCKHGSGDDKWHHSDGSHPGAFCNLCGFCGKCQGTGFSVMSGYQCRSCGGTGNESRDYLQTRSGGTSIAALFGATDKIMEYQREQQRWKIAQAKAALQMGIEA